MAEMPDVDRREGLVGKMGRARMLPRHQSVMAVFGAALVLSALTALALPWREARA